MSLIANLANAQRFTLPLWQGEPPYYQANGEQEQVKKHKNIIKVSQVQIPEMTVFLPSKRWASGHMVLIMPGGGYYGLAWDLEGTDIANMLNSHGIAAAVLKYRLPVSKSNTGQELTPLTDAKQALRLLRKNAQNWQVHANKIGVMGFSAGGHLASTLSTQYHSQEVAHQSSLTELSARPDFSVLIYPVISFNDHFTHQGSAKALLGKGYGDEAQRKAYSSQLNIDANSPPAILIHAADDKLVPWQNSLVYFQALQQFKIKSAMHIYPTGGHGFGLALDNKPLSKWTGVVVDFIKQF
ncbi:alpha/beta hydrolase [Saccharobesus litoralis]|nr:alpha/beta hydrolase [Saccharobesus litoralis]